METVQTIEKILEKRYTDNIFKRKIHINPPGAASFSYRHEKVYTRRADIARKYRKGMRIFFTSSGI
jgi:hypothetical protein